MKKVLDNTFIKNNNQLSNKIKSNVLLGRNFNKIYSNKKFYKLTKKSECHMGFTFVDGINIDVQEFIPELCASSGLHFTDIHNLPTWTDYKTYVREVTISDDSVVVVGFEIFKADKIFLHKRIKLEDFHLWNDESFQINAIRKNACHIRFIKNPSEHIQKMAVRINGLSISYIKNPSIDVQKSAICEYNYSYCYINNPTEEIINFLKIIVDSNELFKKLIKEETDPVETLCVQNNISISESTNENNNMVNKSFSNETNCVIL